MQNDKQENDTQKSPVHGLFTFVTMQVTLLNGIWHDVIQQNNIKQSDIQQNDTSSCFT